ncbi:hypothetical protein ABCR94_02945 [Streptomyces sp. 21So2-11]|uniref:hypothetical protein n=1 Tax=Streptomyces sp. 21So2-11 TaxID=3144408 RepID=UPI00321B4355
MLRHVNAPTRRFTKVSNDLVRHRHLNSDAKILLIHVQGLPESETRKSLSEHAAKLNITGRAYQRAKELLTSCGYLHHWREQREGGRWFTEQVVANVTLTREEASRCRDGLLPPSAQSPTVGGPTGPLVGGSPSEVKTGEKTTPHLPPQDDIPADRSDPGLSVPDPSGADQSDPDEPEPDSTEPDQPAELAEAERVLLSLRHHSRDLYLGAREARSLATAAAQWLSCGITPGELRQALTAGPPQEGIRSAVGFLRHRLREKAPAPATTPATPPPLYAALPPARIPQPLVICAGPGPDHAFRPHGDETRCGPCRTDDPAPTPGPHTAWRDVLAVEAATS